MIIMSAMASEITCVSILYSSVCSGADKRKHQISASLVIVRGIHRWPVNCPPKGSVKRKTFPFDDVIMNVREFCSQVFNWPKVSMGLCNGLKVNWRQAITWSIDGPVCCRIYASSALYGLTLFNLTIDYSIVYSGADQRKHQSSASLAFLQGLHRGPVNSPHKWPISRIFFPFDDGIISMVSSNLPYLIACWQLAIGKKFQSNLNRNTTILQKTKWMWKCRLDNGAVLFRPHWLIVV